MVASNFKNIEVICTRTPEETMDIGSSDGPFGFILLDVDMRDIDPNALGLNLIDFIGEKPILFFGTEQIFKDRITTELLNLNDHNNTVFRPFNRNDFSEDLVGKIQNIANWYLKENESQNMKDINPDDFIKLKINSFYLYKVFPYDIYLAITPSNFMKLISSNTPYTISSLTNYVRRGVKFLYIQKDDQLRFLESESARCIKGMAHTRLDSEDIYLIIIRAITVLHQYLNSVGVTSEALKLAEAVMETIIAQVKSVNGLKKLLVRYPAFYQGIASKSLLCAYLTLYLSRKLEWDSMTTKYKLLLCSLLQDYNLDEDSLSRINNKYSPLLAKYDQETIDDFLQHPNETAKIANLFTQYPDIDFILENHHELPNRQGFPNSPSSTKLTQITAVFNICQYIASDIDGEKMTQVLLSKTLKSMNKDFNHGSFKEPLKLMNKVLKLS